MAVADDYHGDPAFNHAVRSRQSRIIPETPWPRNHQRWSTAEAAFPAGCHCPRRVVGRERIQYPQLHVASVAFLCACRHLQLCRQEIPPDPEPMPLSSSAPGDDYAIISQAPAVAHGSGSRPRHAIRKIRIHPAADSSAGMVGTSSVTNDDPSALRRPLHTHHRTETLIAFGD